MRAIHLAALALAAATLAGAAGGDVPRDAVPPLHAAPSDLERALAEATLAFVREDRVAARAALDRLADGCRKIQVEDEAHFGNPVLAYDRAYHTTVDRAREALTRASLDAAFDQFVWVQRTCRECHTLAREAGLLPPAAPGE